VQSVGIVLAMLAAVLASGALVRVIPLSLPVPLVQIALGILIAAVFNKGIALDPEVFFLLFLPPLLFLDGWRIPKDALRRDWAAIILLALGLVVITVVGLGYLIHWMIPSMPLSVSFALAAIVSPTDAVALKGVANKLSIPRRVFSLLEGEALFNDASGLVAFQAAVLATVTGSFALSDATGSFIWVACAGLASGAITAWAVVTLRNIFDRRFGAAEPGAEVLLSLLMPFAAYFVAEWLEASGILAVVAAGVVTAYTEMTDQLSAATRIRRYAVWDMVRFTLNGIVFVLLGEQLPSVFSTAVYVIREAGHQSPWWLAAYALVICLALAALRFMWVYGAIELTRVLRLRRGPSARYRMRSLLLLSAGGVRGAITLAGVMTLPLTLASGEPFPGRELAVMLATTTIIVSLLVASVSMPLLLRGAPHESGKYRHGQRALARQRVREATRAVLAKEIQTLVKDASSQEESARYANALARILANLDDALGDAPSPDEHGAHAARWHDHERHLQHTALQIARQEVFQLARQGKLSDELAREMIMRLDLDALRLVMN
jgi:CPA1 family monovalent cation:H+ antiporter